MAKVNKKLTAEERSHLLQVLHTRFEKNSQRHKNIAWDAVESKLKANGEKLWSLSEMERTGGEPDVVAYDKKTNEYIFFDCSPETPAGRRSYCYDGEALTARKENKPKNSAMQAAIDMDADLLTEEQYCELQKLGTFDTKTSSWLKTPADIRKRGGAIFGDYRYGQVFIYHNGAESYYAGRAFRAVLRV